MNDDRLRTTLTAAAAVRAAIGATALLAPGPASRVLGYPREQDSPTARLMGRLFGVRDIALGALVWHVRDEAFDSRFVYKLNAWVDAGDAAAMATALIGRQGIDRAALSSAVPALAGATLWFRLLRAEGGRAAGER